MKQKRTFCKRVLTIVLSLALVFSSVNIPSVTVQAAVTNEYECTSETHGATYDAEAGTVTFFLTSEDSQYEFSTVMWYKWYESYEAAAADHISNMGNFISSDDRVEATYTDEDGVKSVVANVTEASGAYLYYFNCSGIDRAQYEHIIVIGEGSGEGGGEGNEDLATPEQIASLQSAYDAAVGETGNDNSEGTYTAASWSTYEAALTAAKGVLDKGNAATAAEVTTALNNLDNAKEGLVEEAQVEPIVPVEGAINLEDKKTNSKVTEYAKYGHVTYVYDGVSMTATANPSGTWGGEWDAQWSVHDIAVTAGDWKVEYDIVSNINNKEIMSKLTKDYGGDVDTPIVTETYNLTKDATSHRSQIATIAENGTVRLFFRLSSPTAEDAGTVTISNIKVSEIDMDAVADEEDKADLQAAYDTAAAEITAGNTTGYSEETWTAYSEAVAAALAVLDNESATVQQVEEALAALQEAKAGLRMPVEGDPVTAEGYLNLEVKEQLGEMTYWTEWTDYAIYDYDETQVVVTIKSGGNNDSAQWTIENLPVVPGDWTVEYDIITNIPDKAIVSVFRDSGNQELIAGDSYKLEANTSSHRKQEVTLEEADTANLFFMLSPGGENGGTITISNIKIWREIPESEQPATAQEKAALQTAYEEAEAIVTAGKGDYPTVAWNAFTKAVDDAEAVLDKAEPTKGEVADALAALTETKAALVVPTETSVVISENQGQVKVGEPITLTYVANKGTFSFGDDYTVTINGTEVDKTGIVINATTITIPASLNTTAGVAEIVFAKANCVITPVYQTVYATDTTDEWTLVWQDEFAGTELDPAKWDYQTGNGSEYSVSGWGNEEEEWYTDSEENSYVSDGTLTITAKKDNTYEGANYTSARLRTVTEEIVDGKATKGTALKADTYGRIEAKIKMPVGDGIWPAFWMLPYDSEYGTWAASGELDIMEARGRLPETVCGTIHYGGPWPNNVHKSHDYVDPEGEFSIDDYHIYAVEWDPDKITWFVDGEEYGYLSNWYAEAGEDGNWPYPAPFDEEFYILLNLAVGGTFDSVASEDIEVDANGVSMNVDYVRWYQRDAEVYENWEIEQGDVPKDNSAEAQALLAKADANGNFLTDGDFSAMDTNVVTQWDAATAEGWLALLHGGQGTWEKVNVADENYIKVAVANAGAQNYAVQMIQYFPAVKGYSYEISYKAYTDSVSPKGDVSLKIGGDEDNAWAVYSSSYTDNITTTPTTYKHQFTMQNDTDPRARFEFNLSTSAGNVYLTDVSVKIIDGINESEGEDDAKEPLSNGNHIYNSDFQIGTDGLLYWHWTGDDAANVVYAGKNGAGERVANVVVPADGTVSMWQYGLNLLQSDTYTLSFKVDSSEAQDIVVAMTNADGTVEYLPAVSKTQSVAAGESTVQIEFTMPEAAKGTAVDGKLMITFAKSATVDKVTLVRNTNLNVDFGAVNMWPLYNGDFFNGLDGWLPWHEGVGYQVTTVNNAGQLQAEVTIGKNGTFYCVGLKSPSMTLTKGIKYRVEFDYSIPSDKTYTLELAGVQREITLDADETHYVSEAFSGNGSTALTFYLGPNQTDTYTLKLDNVEVIVDMVVPEGYEKPVSVAQQGKGSLNNGAVAWFTEDAAWEVAANKKFYIDGEEIEASKVTIDYTANTITIDGSVFEELGEWDLVDADNFVLSVGADGYCKTLGTNLTILDGNLIVGGTMNDPSAWSIYTEDPGLSEGVIADGVYKLNYNAGRHNGSMWVSWDSQLKQGNISVEADKTYVFRFMASTNMTDGRDIIIEHGVTGSMAQKTIHIDEGGMVTYEFEITPTITTDFYSFNFLVAAVGENLSSEDTSTAYVAPHTLYIDNVFFGESNDYLKVIKRTLASYLNEYEGKNGSAYTTNSWEKLQTALAEGKEIYDSTTSTRAEIEAVVLKIANAIEGLQPAADKSALRDVIEKFGNVKGREDDEKFMAFKNAHDAGKQLAENGNAPQADVDKAIEDIKKAYLAFGKAKLATDIETYKGMTQGVYTDASWAAFQTALTNANTVSANEAATAEEVKTAVDALDVAYAALTNAIDKTALNAVIEKYATVTGDETNANYVAFKTAYDAAKALVDSTTVTQADLDAAVAAVNSTYLTYVKALLTADVTTYAAMEQLAYTDATWNAFQTALAAAQTVLANAEATADAIVAADTALDAAYKALVEKEGLWIKNIPDQVYTGSAIKPDVEVWDGNKKLTLKKDYTISYSRNVNVGTATVTVKGRGNYADKDSKNFKIVGKDLDNLDDTKLKVTTSDVYTVIAKNGSIKQPKITVKYGKKALKVNRDYTVEGLDKATAAGSYELTIKAVPGSNYTGSTTITYDVLANNTLLMSKAKITLDINTTVYKGLNGKETQLPKVTAVKIGSTTFTEADGAYTVEYPEDIKIGKVAIVIRGVGEKGVYGTKAQTFTVTGTKFTTRNISVDAIADQPYTGEKIEPTLVVRDSAKTDPLKLGTDYIVDYTKNVNVGTAKVTITGIGAYTGKITKNFKITKINLGTYKTNENLVWTYGEDVKADYAQTGATPEFSLTYMGKELVAKKDYTVTYRNNKTAGGVASITIKGKGNFEGQINDTFKVTTPDESTIYAVAADVKVPNSVAKLKASLKVYEKSTGKALKAGKDYDKVFKYYIVENGVERDVTPTDLKFDQDINVRITLKGNYAGTGEKAQTVETTFRLYTIKATSLRVDAITPQPYTGEAIEPTIVVRDPNKAAPLVKGTDYDVEYQKNVDKGTAKVIITGIGNEYGGSKTVTFKITQHKLKWEWKDDITSAVSNFFKNLF